jgi:hypothetical protein
MTGYYDIPHANDAMAMRRANAGGGFGASEPAGWSSPEQSQQAYQQPQQAQGGGSYYGGGNSITGSVGSSGDPYLDQLRNTGMADAQGQAYASRLHAMNAAPNDPSMAAFAGLQAQIGGQSNAAHNLNDAGMQYSQQQRQQQWQQQWQEHIAQLQHQWQMEQIQSQNNASLWGGVGQLAGSAMMAFA